MVAWLAAVLTFVTPRGRESRLRNTIREELNLLTDLEAQPGLGRGTEPYEALETHIAWRVSVLVGPRLKRSVDLSTAAVAFLLFLGFAFWTWRVLQDAHKAEKAFPWYGWALGVATAVWLLGFIGTLWPSKQEGEPETPRREGNDS